MAIVSGLRVFFRPMGNETTAATNGPRTSRWPWTVAALVAIAGTALSFSLKHARDTLDRRAIEGAFLIEAQQTRNAIAQEINLFIEVLASIRQLHAISDQISAENFGEFVEKGMAYQREILGGFGFVQRMDHYTRQLLDQPPESTAEPNLRMVEPSAGGGFVPAAARPEYYPLTYQRPTNALPVPVGFDFNSVPEFRAAIETMSLSGQTVIGGRAASAEPDPRSERYYLFSPILYKTIQGIAVQPPGFLIGFVVALFDPQVILTRAIGDQPATDLTIELLNPFSPDAVSGATPEGSPPLRFEAAIAVANQSWIFRCSAGDDYVSARDTRQPALILAAGLLITGLLTLEFLLMAMRSRRIERVVQTRTAALQEAKTLLEREIAERARLENEILEIGNREKLRIGQDLHDSLGQKLTGAVFLSRALTGKLESAAPEERDESRRINEILKEALAQVRRLAQGLAPIELGSEGLVNALRRLAADTESTYGIACVFQSRVRDAAPAGKTAMHLYHIAQEAVSNAVRHGKATEISLTLSSDAGGGELLVEDNGPGLPDDAAQRGGMGLQIMKHRAAMLGGALHLRRRPEGGTAVVCHFGAA